MHDVEVHTDAVPMAPDLNLNPGWTVQVTTADYTYEFNSNHHTGAGLLFTKTSQHAKSLFTVIETPLGNL